MKSSYQWQKEEQNQKKKRCNFFMDILMTRVYQSRQLEHRAMGMITDSDQESNITSCC